MYSRTSMKTLLPCRHALSCILSLIVLGSIVSSMDLDFSLTLHVHVNYLTSVQIWKKIQHMITGSYFELA